MKNYDHKIVYFQSFQVPLINKICIFSISEHGIWPLFTNDPRLKTIYLIIFGI